jgi:signal transduction histidine kinase
MDELYRVLHEKASIAGIQHRFRTKEGSWVWLESKGSNHIANHSIQGILINSRNINDRVELQQRLNYEMINKQKEITAAVIRAQETERSQLGLELHDNVNQVLTTVKLYNEMYLTGMVQDKEILLKSSDYIQECINEIRSISKRLSAPTLGSISLQDSIQELVDSINLTNRVRISCAFNGLDLFVVSEDLHLGIYRIVQESLNNVLKYAGADTVLIELNRKENELCLRISDDGQGFDTSIKRKGIGITNMRTRAENLNGSFFLSSAPGQGCTLRICFHDIS